MEPRMANKVTKAERMRIQNRASQLVHLDADTQVIDRVGVIQQLVDEFDISRDRAQTAISRVAMRERARKGAGS
jgi:hypothetical protein